MDKSDKPNIIYTEAFDLDNVLIKELGQFGLFQLRNIVFVAIPVLLSAGALDYTFSVAPIPHRCQIPECGETSKDHVFDPKWILNAIPETASGFESCRRFMPLGPNGTLDYCPASFFNRPNTIECDGYVYERDTTVVYDFDLGCKEWLRVLPGMISNIGSLLGLPIAGYISDNFGRRVVLIVCMFNMALFGFIRAFSVNYPMYLALTLLQTTVGAGAFSAAYILATELVGPKYRVIAGASISAMFAVSQVMLGAVAWGIPHWKYFIITLNVPCFLLVALFWILSESVRWLISRQKYDEARKILKKVAKINKTEISAKTLLSLSSPPAPAQQQKQSDVQKGPGLIRIVINSPTLLRRVCTTPVWWVTTTFIYYGLSINSVGLFDQMYINYILTCAIEIPGFYTAVLLLNKIGRKTTLSGAFFLSAACNIAFIFISDDLYVLSLIVYLLGKFSISAGMTSLYLYTSELYPTKYRHSLLAFSSMIGRIGSITAPLTPALMKYWNGIPFVMFGAMGLISGLLVLTQPETRGVKMPDTIKEAETLGRS